MNKKRNYKSRIDHKQDSCQEYKISIGVTLVQDLFSSRGKAIAEDSIDASITASHKTFGT